jgi:hypothetical protein
LWIAAADGAALALVLAAASLALWRVDDVSIASVVVGMAAAVGATVALAFARRNSQAVARAVEQRASHCRNVIVTAAELLDRPERSHSYVSRVVIADAARMTQSLSATALFPSRRSIARVAGGAIACAIVLLLTSARPSASRAHSIETSNVATIDRVDVIVTPPVYTGRPKRNLRDPSRIEAIAGSRIQIEVRGVAASLSFETLSGPRPANSSEPGVFSAELIADADGYIAMEPRTTAGSAGARRLIGLSVTPDASPRVRITLPVGDLIVPDTSRRIDVSIESSDDFGLASLKLRYTKVSGSGERFTFTEGEVPLAVTRDSAKAWRGRGTLALSTFGLSQGDMLVYRGVAADARPGATPAESDTYIVEIAAPGGVAAAGFAIDDERDRYGLSQQMVIVKTERLIAKRSSLSPDSLRIEALTIAAEQRAVRAEFVFMMGGELAEEVMEAAGLGDLDETKEAEAEDDILAGRLANRGRIELVRAIRSMSRAATGLTSSDLEKALADEKAALGYLQGAFARARYILRALTERERLDLSRRLSGSLLGVLRDSRPPQQGVIDSTAVTLRRVLADVAALGGTVELSGDEAARAARLAQEVLRADASSSALQNVASSLAAASRFIEGRDLINARRTLGIAAAALSASLRTHLPAAPRRARPLELEQLNGALIDALRTPGRTR